MFIFVPIQQIVSIGIQLLGGLLALIAQSPVLFFIFAPLASFVLPILIEVIIAIGAFAYSISQAKYIVE